MRAVCAPVRRAPPGQGFGSHLQIGLRLSIVGLMIGFARGVARAGRADFAQGSIAPRSGSASRHLGDYAVGRGGRVDGYRPPDLRGFRTLAERREPMPRQSADGPAAATFCAPGVTAGTTTFWRSTRGSLFSGRLGRAGHARGETDHQPDDDRRRPICMATNPGRGARPARRADGRASLQVFGALLQAVQAPHRSRSIFGRFVILGPGQPALPAAAAGSCILTAGRAGRLLLGRAC